MFKDYQTDCYFDEMLEQGKPKQHYEQFYSMLNQLSNTDFQEKNNLANSSFLRQGITFTVYGEEGGTERTMPTFLEYN
ncbi:MAG: hypothetical protein ACI35P_00690 [Bacillus sp. (in: firmicutes)]